MDLLRSSFEWARITPKLHILACHAADWLDRYGSLGLFAEQGLEAWHGYFNQNSTVFAADSFLESCVRLVKRAAVSRGPGDSAFNLGKRRAPAPANARCAKRPSDMRTPRARAAAGMGTRQSAAFAATASANADKWASNTVSLHPCPTQWTDRCPCRCLFVDTQTRRSWPRNGDVPRTCGTLLTETLG